MSDEIRSAQSVLNQQVMGKDGVEGTAIGLHRGAPCLKVYVSTEGVRKTIPKRLKGFPVVVEVSGGFRRFGRGRR